MKKLSSISNQIQNNTFSYTGKGSFEAIVTKHKQTVIDWLEDLIPLQNQMEMLKELEGLEFQKRNYTRILTKLLPDQYTEFVSLNILVRDSNTIASYYNEEYNITILYDKLINDKYLKYPGKYEKYVTYTMFQKFVMTYKDDLIKSLENQDPLIENEKTYAQEFTNSIKDEATHDEPVEKVQKEKETNWTNLLLGKIR